MIDVINFKIYLWLSFKAVSDREKGEEDWNTKIGIASDQKELFRWNKKHFP